MASTRFLLATSLLVMLLASTEALRLPKKPLCETCQNVVKTVDAALEHGADIEEAVDDFCKNEVPAFLTQTCEKIVAKNLKYIIEKLKNHESAEVICTAILLCSPEQE